MKKLNSWGNTVLYGYKHTDGCTYNVEIETVRDGIGSLKRVQCGLTGYFECYGMAAVKKRLTEAKPHQLKLNS